MSTLSRLCLLTVLAAATLAGGANRNAFASVGTGSSRVLTAASRMLAHQTPSRVVRWFEHQPGIAAATVESDRRSIDIRFRTGLQAVILPSTHHVSAVSRPLGRSAHPFDSTPSVSGHGRRALLLLPFATEMGLLGHADREAALLRAAGFTVDALTDANVNVDQLVHISSYDLGYMVTHSNSNRYGDVVIATGAPVDPDHVIPAMDPLIKEGSVIITGIAGSPFTYYGIRARYIRDHLDGSFPRNAMLFFNSCNLIPGTLLWQDLAERGASTSARPSATFWRRSSPVTGRSTIPPPTSPAPTRASSCSRRGRPAWISANRRFSTGRRTKPGSARSRIGGRRPGSSSIAATAAP